MLGNKIRKYLRAGPFSTEVMKISLNNVGIAPACLTDTTSHLSLFMATAVALTK